jgi:hypothetical protein
MAENLVHKEYAVNYRKKENVSDNSNAEEPGDVVHII